MSPIVVVAEKPSVARDIAAALGVKKQRKGYWEGQGYCITWAIGHLVGLAQPHEIKQQWKAWSQSYLPMLPQSWPLVILERTKEQYDLVKSLLCAEAVQKVICATDAGREGELIFRYIYEKAQCNKPVERLWISSLTPQAIKKGFELLKPASYFDALAESAKGRSRADWLVGMNLSRAYSLKSAEHFSVGRVQTPTLSMLVAREMEIANFQAEEYLELKVNFKSLEESPKAETLMYEGVFFDPTIKNSQPRGRGQQDKDIKQSPKDSRLPKDGRLAKKVQKRALTGKASIDDIKEQKTKILPPLLFDLTELQRVANRLRGFSAQKTLSVAQELYEKKKLISYPRTDSRYLSPAVAETLPAIVEQIKGPYASLLLADTGRTPLSERYINEAKVSDHHAIIPTGIQPGALSSDMQFIYELICKRLLAAWQEPYISSTTTMVTLISGIESSQGYKDHYRSKGSVIIQLGWKALEPGSEQKNIKVLPNLIRASRVEAVDTSLLKKKTKPPASMTEARLLTEMERAGAAVDDKEFSEAMRENGLGTPATRAQIIETLIKREYVYREGKRLKVTDKANKLIDMVDLAVKSPKMTGEWEAYLAQIERGQKSLGQFTQEIEAHLKSLVPQILASNLMEKKNKITTTPVVEATELEDLEQVLAKKFGFSGFRGRQKEICEAVVAGGDHLVVMPTGAGKSLCYQLPGLALNGTTIIISPLIALMEDQVQKLEDKQLRAGRIHSGRDREYCRNVCRQYLKGELDYLFIAPERLGVPGFLELLEKRQPVLIAIDEAHCISQWGHDFRADYRMLGERLQRFSQTPKLALTATACEQVQKDIIEQLALNDCKSFICGFRRDNISIEVASIAVDQRLAAIKTLLKKKSQRPAILYVATRKDAEQYAKQLASSMSIAAYHAGMPAPLRQSVQDAFLNGSIEVIVATVAFGMGVDKADVRSVIHLTLPSTVAGYYQEIGRAGRDGKPSRAILMYSLADHKTQLFLHEINYPDVAKLRVLLGKIPSSGIDRGLLEQFEEADAVQTMLQKLWIHGAVQFQSFDRVLKSGVSAWEKSYNWQKQHRHDQLKQMMDFAQEQEHCRMLELIRYFGDRSDVDKVCGICDVCKPESATFTMTRTSTPEEISIMKTILELLKERKIWSTGSLYKTIGGFYDIEKELFEALLSALAREAYLELEMTSFVKGSRTIHFRQVKLAYHNGPSKPLSKQGLNIVEPLIAVSKKKKSKYKRIQKMKRL